MEIEKILGLDGHASQHKYVCFLPFRGEFGWYLMTFVKRVQGYNHLHKIVCVKPGHECLFPSAEQFFYDWLDIADELKAGIHLAEDEEILKEKIRASFHSDDIFFVSTTDTSWDEKLSLANYTFLPQSKHNHNLVTDVVFTPRKRQIDAHRNWTQENWQIVVDSLLERGISIGVCGTRETSFPLTGVKYCSFDYVDVDSDVELLNNTKLVVSQESGLSYLSYLCKRPTLIIDHYFRDHGADLHRDLSVFFKEVKYVWYQPELLIKEIVEYLSTC